MPADASASAPAPRRLRRTGTFVAKSSGFTRGADILHSTAVRVDIEGAADAGAGAAEATAGVGFLSAQERLGRVLERDARGGAPPPPAAVGSDVSSDGGSPGATAVGALAPPPPLEGMFAVSGTRHRRVMRVTLADVLPALRVRPPLVRGVAVFGEGDASVEVEAAEYVQSLRDRVRALEKSLEDARATIDAGKKRPKKMATFLHKRAAPAPDADAAAPPAAAAAPPPPPPAPVVVMPDLPVAAGVPPVPPKIVFPAGDARVAPPGAGAAPADPPKIAFPSGYGPGGAKGTAPPRVKKPVPASNVQVKIPGAFGGASAAVAAPPAKPAAPTKPKPLKPTVQIPTSSLPRETVPVPPVRAPPPKPLVASPASRMGERETERPRRPNRMATVLKRTVSFGGSAQGKNVAASAAAQTRTAVQPQRPMSLSKPAAPQAPPKVIPPVSPAAAVPMPGKTSRLRMFSRK